MPDLPENERESRVWQCECGWKGSGKDMPQGKPPGTCPRCDRGHCTNDLRPAPTTNLAEKLREKGLRAKHADVYHAFQESANTLDRAIPSEVWGEFNELIDMSVRLASEYGAFPPKKVAALVQIRDTFCPPEIAQQHGWEPCREETE